jgi:peptide/nickel transport system substrate-binding protein
VGALAFASSLLAACGGDDDDDDDASDEDTTSGGDTADAPTATEASTDEEPDATTADDSDTADETEDEGDTEDEGETAAGGEAPGVMGGTGRVALYSEPPTLDSSWTTAIVVLVPSQHVFEYLFAWDSNWDIQPHIADGFEVSDDGLSYTFTLREGVTFHNGDGLVADDIVKCLNRWGQLVGEGVSTYEAVTEVVAADDYTVEITLSQPFSPLLAYLTGPGGGMMVMPGEIAEAAGTERLEEYIGTGPFSFVEHIPDRHILLERFEEYSPREEPPDAFAGRRTAYFDELEFITVPDAAARIAGVEAGDYDWAEEVTRDEHERLQDSGEVEPLVIKPLRFMGVVFNKAEGPMADPVLRQAALYALNHEEIMAAAFGPPDFWRLQPSLMPPESVWFTEVGAEFYNPYDPDRARELVEESSYNGETIRWMGPSDREDYFGVALTGVQHLQDVGINAELVSMDWGSLVERRTEPGEYEIFNTGFSFNPEPTTLSFIAANWPGWWESEAKDEILDRIMTETDFEARMAVWEEFQTLYFEEVPIIRVGDFFGLSVKRSNLQGENLPLSSFPIFWNVWIDEG